MLHAHPTAQLRDACACVHATPMRHDVAQAGGVVVRQAVDLRQEALCAFCLVHQLCGNNKIKKDNQHELTCASWYRP